MICLTPLCERLPERNGYCGTCNREKRKEEQRAQRQKLVVKKIRKVSPKMAKALQEYSKLKKSFLENQPFCAVYPRLPAVDIHHMKGRGTIELLLDYRYWLGVSREGHIWIETHPKEAKERGYNLDRLAK